MMDPLQHLGFALRRRSQLSGFHVTVAQVVKMQPEIDVRHLLHQRAKFFRIFPKLERKR